MLTANSLIISEGDEYVVLGTDTVLKIQTISKTPDTDSILVTFRVYLDEDYVKTKTVTASTFLASAVSLRLRSRSREDLPSTSSNQHYPNGYAFSYKVRDLENSDFELTKAIGGWSYSPDPGTKIFDLDLAVRLARDYDGEIIEVLERQFGKVLFISENETFEYYRPRKEV